MTKHRERFTHQTYRQEKPDGSSKLRDILVPDEETRRRHAAMLSFMYSIDIPIPYGYAVGGVPGFQLLDNVEPHRQSDNFYMVDLKDAFQNVNIDVLCSTVLDKMVFNEEHRDKIRTFIYEWAVSDQVPGLPLGAPCSPFLFNLYCAAMDIELAKHCYERGIVYTRYLDDLTFSSKAPMGRKRRQKINALVEDVSGMEINHAKSKVHSIERGPVTITGVSIYPDRRIAAGPNLHETYQTLMDDLLAKLENGLELSEEEIGRLHGYNGAIHQMTDGETPTIRRLDRKYRQILGRVASQEFVGLQLALFGEQTP